MPRKTHCDRTIVRPFVGSRPVAHKNIRFWPQRRNCGPPAKLWSWHAGRCGPRRGNHRDDPCRRRPPRQSRGPAAEMGAEPRTGGRRSPRQDNGMELARRAGEAAEAVAEVAFLNDSCNSAERIDAEPKGGIGESRRRGVHSIRSVRRVVFRKSSMRYPLRRISAAQGPNDKREARCIAGTVC
jgi:hypothetical protein